MHSQGGKQAVPQVATVSGVGLSCFFFLLGWSVTEVASKHLRDFSYPWVRGIFGPIWFWLELSWQPSPTRWGSKPQCKCIIMKLYVTVGQPWLGKSVCLYPRVSLAPVSWEFTGKCLPTLWGVYSEVFTFPIHALLLLPARMNIVIGKYSDTRNGNFPLLSKMQWGFPATLFFLEVLHIHPIHTENTSSSFRKELVITVVKQLTVALINKTSLTSLVQ